jgi:hypothetical protein
MFWRNYIYTKPTWLVDYEFYEHRIAKRAGVEEKKLREILELMMEYKILVDDG